MLRGWLRRFVKDKAEVNRGMTKLAVVLFNLGGPNRPEDVRPFLFNLFSDRAIIDLPQPLRWLVAQMISRRRAPVAQEIYRQLGGGSPLLANTEAQAAVLEMVLRDRLSDPNDEVRTFLAMRYWQPRSEETAAAVRTYDPDHLILLPLYPQYSTATTASSLADWRAAAKRCGLKRPGRAICCYPRQLGFVAEMATALGAALAEAGKAGRPRVLFSAHGLPQKVVDAGDPYQWQVEESAAAIVQALGHDRGETGAFDWLVCYQSRVGPLEWLKPYTEQEIERAGRDGVPLIVVPLAFVSEHSETLVELDIEYRKLAEESGVPVYLRVPTVGTGRAFIDGLADLVVTAVAAHREGGAKVASGDGGRICPATHRRCAQARTGQAGDD
jgi:ferrochelatase